MPKITEREFEASYQLAKEVYERRESFKNAVVELVDKYQMDKGSAKFSITFFLNLIKGRRYTRTLSKGHIKFYMEAILRDYRKEKLKTFLQGLEQHIAYREDSGVNVPGFRGLHNEFSKKIGITTIY